ncbi:MAG: hypothetical protein GX219_07315 [Tissierellia bacterium]|nr:hypothetical protein [Tissierellia bacterium]
MNYLPVILGTDVNAYGMARAFYEEYGKKSLLIGRGRLFMTENTKILDVLVYEELTDDFVGTLTRISESLKDRYDVLILIASSDEYAAHAIKHKEELKDIYSMPFIDYRLFDRLSDKKSFYETCEEYGLDYPKTAFISRDNYREVENKFGYPVVLKASNSVKYLALDFEGKKKAFIIDSEEELRDVLNKIYQTQYDDYMILQDFIPGDDSNMYVLNAYVNSAGEVSLMALGHSLMEDPSPDLIGNYLAITDTNGDKIYPMYKKFLEEIAYTGFANFDMKYDRRDGKYKVFEINLRQGRSSFFTTLAGANLSRALVDDFVEGKRGETTYPDKEFLWLGANFDTVIEYVKDEEIKKEMLKKKPIAQNTLYYEEDMNFIRRRSLKKYFDRYDERFKEHFVQKE